MALLVDVDGEGEAAAGHAPASEPELVPEGEVAAEHLQRVAGAGLLHHAHLVQVGGHGGWAAVAWLREELGVRTLQRSHRCCSFCPWRGGPGGQRTAAPPCSGCTPAHLRYCRYCVYTLDNADLLLVVWAGGGPVRGGARPRHGGVLGRGGAGSATTNTV